ncbi:thioredoxin TrxC [Paraglaciecola arctica]|uniref:thioredoxin TrxC n=1 Tax=Paraglaciecola arctica TaxID=1128911 RepID=UPI001C075E29|nr:thioredoxin TrxC [Paraglaciecola arctica]MBU3004095.1 thioredoxin TrxC [Paraglaciecola arctica]
MHIVCSHCHAINRIPEGKSHTQAKCGKCHEVAYSATPIELTDNSFYRYIEKNDLPVIVDFWASWCGPCQAMAPGFNSVAKQSEELLFAKVNTEQARQVSADAAIRSIPTLIFFLHGKEINRVSGGLSESQLKSWIMQCLQKLN